MSRPGNVSPDVLEKRPDVLVIDGGVIELPGKPDLGWNFGFDKGLGYACMSETIILALEKIYANTSIGADLNLEYMNQLKEYAAVHGFRLAGFRSFDLPLPDSVWQRVVAARESLMKSEPMSI
jgi:predicted amino acid dehydrogenase